MRRRVLLLVGATTSLGLGAFLVPLAGLGRPGGPARGVAGAPAQGPLPRSPGWTAGPAAPRRAKPR